MMISALWHTIVYQPLYNILILLIAVLPEHSVGIAIIILTIIVRLALFPLTGKSIRAQKAMKELEPEIKKIREKYKDDKQEQAKKTMELYQEKGVTPFSGCLPLFIQIPIIIGLYLVFKDLLVPGQAALYSFVTHPGALDMHFLFFDLAGKSAILAACAGIAQYFQADLSLGRQTPPVAAKSDSPTFQEDFARSMQMQMRYVLPVMISFIAFNTSAAVALYWTTSNILSIIQELLIRRSASKTA
jgi:YidC/Oxa1 family membrane protein insertase